jgi:hypothetical protein
MTGNIARVEEISCINTQYRIDKEAIYAKGPLVISSITPFDYNRPKII